MIREFPSPLGEMGLSIRCGERREQRAAGGEFPSPLGEMGLSIVLTMRARRDNSRIHSMYQYLTHAFSILK